MMKKFFATLLCLALVAGLFAACSGSKDNNAKADSAFSPPDIRLRD